MFHCKAVKQSLPLCKLEAGWMSCNSAENCVGQKGVVASLLWYLGSQSMFYTVVAATGIYLHTSFRANVAIVSHNL